MNSLQSRPTPEKGAPRAAHEREQTSPACEGGQVTLTVSLSDSGCTQTQSTAARCLPMDPATHTVLPTETPEEQRDGLQVHIPHVNEGAGVLFVYQDVMMCGMCNKQFVELMEFLEHKSQHTCGPNLYKCELCKAIVWDQAVLLDHYSNHHNVSLMEAVPHGEEVNNTVTDERPETEQHPHTDPHDAAATKATPGGDAEELHEQHVATDKPMVNSGVKGPEYQITEPERCLDQESPGRGESLPVGGAVHHVVDSGNQEQDGKKTSVVPRRLIARILKKSKLNRAKSNTTTDDSQDTMVAEVYQATQVSSSRGKPVNGTLLTSPVANGVGSVSSSAEQNRNMMAPGLPMAEVPRNGQNKDVSLLTQNIGSSPEGENGSANGNINSAHVVVIAKPKKKKVPTATLR